MKAMRKVLCLIAVLCLMAAVMAPAAFADDIGFPEKETITLVVPGKAGGGSDLAIRYYAQALTDLYGQLTSTLGIELNPVEMGSESDRLTNLAGGFIDIGVVGVGHGVEYETAGKLKVIGTVASDGVTIDGYPEKLPDNYKTLQEQGFMDCYFGVGHYLLGPAGMDPDMVAKMNAAMEAVYEATKEDIAKIGNIPGWHNLEESQAIRQAEYDQLVEIAKAIDLYEQG
jgi:tripartite-type tricarboxylate transporter receptor subunit TctC